MQVPDPLSILRNNFGHQSFRPGQAEIIEFILKGRDTLVIMPTGSGKSLCYQIPALVNQGVTLVISPLIALMKDQVDALCRLKISATFLNSSLAADELEQRIHDVRRGMYNLVYIAPERFYAASFMKLINQIDVSIVAVDEAHCISQWGHDFRPAYLRIRDVIRQIGKPTVVALTATATRQVQQDIIKQLSLQNPEILVSGFDRPNLKYFAVELDAAQKKRELIRILSAIKGTGIVYTATKNAVTEVTDVLNRNGLPSIGYHGGMEKNERSRAQNLWLTGEKTVIVATNAFGMGIDKPDVRFVLHYNLPGSVESYYQEAGRAGRDGKTAYCILFSNYQDRKIQEFLIENTFPSEDVLRSIYEFLFNLSQDTILLTYREIGERVGCNDMKVAAAVKLFERYKLLKRLSKNVLTFRVDFLKSFKSARKMVARAEMQKKLLAWLEKQISQTHSLEHALKALNFSREQFNNAMRELVNKKILVYTPPFRGRGIERTSAKIRWEKIPIDFEAYNARMQIQFDRLEELERYLQKKQCRRRFILDYFGETYKKSNCGGCDFCLDWQSPEADSVTGNASGPIKTIVRCVYDFDGVFGLTTIAKILKGVDEQRFYQWDVMDNEFFAIMQEKPLNKINRMIFVAINEGLLERSTGKYPKLSVTEEGLKKVIFSQK